MAEDIVIKLTADFFKTLAHPVRLRILQSLEQGERCVCEIIEELDIEQSNLSQHLSNLKKQGIIDSRKDGQKVIYRIVYPSVLEIVSAAEKTLSEQIGASQSILKFLK
ncbi:putative HTH-type transcriptional regulator [Sporomusa ovata DSM 2662]|uniref:Transcriptional regulator, ArsR family n=1 Tax=Sporomusa ovata TaxID=2378 RepID=A0A0U1KTV0_9FIRM|nr:metalloregulator ArsR/SmtB family transcription factor [Sporomusa ovata]EQB26775.1 transcriptional regulator, ArsR family [Sporomusa ovata DSM 2662]CQR70870.1 Transcriptional regulator, ArsR family [Sporomusa ovata]